MATITPLENTECEMNGCGETHLVAIVEPDNVDGSRTLCPLHGAEYMNEVFLQ